MEILSDSCRICLRTEKNANIDEDWYTVPLKELDTDDISYEEKFIRCTGIKIVPSARLGKLICGKCLIFLKKMYSFLRICLKADKILRSKIIKEEVLVFDWKMTNENMKEEHLFSDDNADYDIDCQQSTTDKNNISIEDESVCKKNDTISEYQAESDEETARNIENETFIESESPEQNYDKFFEMKFTRRDKYKSQSCVCEICGIYVKKRYLLQQHQMTHKETKDFKCGICGKGFAHQQYLASHVIRHSDNKKHACAFCSRRFYTKGDLNEHENGVHKHKQVYECEDCGKKFFYQQSLKRHQLCHKDFKPYLCTFCHRTFRTSSNLAQHFKTDVHKDAATHLFVKLSQ